MVGTGIASSLTGGGAGKAMETRQTRLKRFGWASVLTLILCFFSACTPQPEQGDTTNPIIITISSGTRNTDYRLKEFELFTRLNYPEIEGTPDPEMAATIFEDFKKDLTLATISQAYGIRILSPDVDRFAKDYLHPLGYTTLSDEERELWRLEVKRRMAIRELLRRKILKNITVTDEQVAEYYDQEAANFKKDAQYRIRFVQTATKERAKELLSRLKKGDETFKNLAAEFAENDGHMFAVPMRLEELSEPFSRVIQKMKPGRYSKVITLQQFVKEPVDEDASLEEQSAEPQVLEQYYVIYLESIISAVEISYEDAYHYIGEELQGRFCREALAKMLENFAQSPKFTVRVHPENLPFTYTEGPKDKEV